MVEMGDFPGIQQHTERGRAWLIPLPSDSGLNLVPTSVQYLPGVFHTTAISGLLPTAVIVIVLNPGSARRHLTPRPDSVADQDGAPTDAVPSRQNPSGR